MTKGAPIPDQSSPTGFSTPWYTKGGTLLHSTPGATPPTSQITRQTTTSSQPTESGGTVSSRTTGPVNGGVGGSLPVRPTPRNPAPVSTTPGTTPQASGGASSNAARDADDLFNKRISPSQLVAQIGGRGAQKNLIMNHIKDELKKKDPNFNWEDAEATYQLAKSPGFQQTVRYIDNTIDSLPRLQAAADKLNNGTFKSLNALKNMTAQQLNGVDIRVFDTDRQLVGDEIAKLLQGGGTGSGTSDKKLEQGQNIIKTSDDPKLVAATLKEVGDLIHIRRNSLT